MTTAPAPAPVRLDRESPVLAPEPAGKRRVGAGLLDPKQLWLAVPEALRKLNPVTLFRNPVMFVTEIGAALTTGLAIAHPTVFGWLITVWLWLTVVFGNLAEALAESRGRAQADSLRRTRKLTTARRLTEDGEQIVHAIALRRGDTVVVEAREIVPGDGDVIEGVASVDESAITGESAPVIRESGGDRSAVTGGIKVLSDRIVVRITQSAQARRCCRGG
jgi:K+-transporting ATPase ATPase B chain